MGDELFDLADEADVLHNRIVDAKARVMRHGGTARDGAMGLLTEAGEAVWTSRERLLDAAGGIEGADKRAYLLRELRAASTACENVMGYPGASDGVASEARRAAQCIERVRREIASGQVA